MGVGEELFVAEFAAVDVGEDCLLGEVLAVDDAGLRLQHAPRLSPLDAEHDQLAGEGAVFCLAVLFELDVDAEVGDEGAVAGREIAAIDHVLLSYADQHVVERDELVSRFRLELS